MHFECSSVLSSALVLRGQTFTYEMQLGAARAPQSQRASQSDLVSSEIDVIRGKRCNVRQALASV
jgi:hypothetical protein